MAIRLSTVTIIGTAFVLAAGLSLVAASFAVTAIEEGSETAVRHALDINGHEWAEVEADGLKVILSGTARDEATRFVALSVAGGEVDAARVIDEMQIAPAEALAPPHFSAEILRNDSGISIIGLIPAATDRDALISDLNGIDDVGLVTDLLETAAYPPPAGWEDALSFAVSALKRLHRSKVSVDAGQIAITAISDSIEDKRALEAELNRAAPPGLRMALDIAAPRPVITPFTLRYVIDQAGGRFDACSAENGESRARILAAARDIGLTGPADCTVGMGVPSPNWALASDLSLHALAKLGSGSVTISNVDITLVAAMGTNAVLFDRVVGELENALPQVFSLRAVLPVPEDAPEDLGPQEFTATLSPEGMVQLRGRLSDENLRHMADSYAKSRFGTQAVYTAARVAEGLPGDWPIRVLAGLEGLSMLANGALIVTPDVVELRGTTERETGKAEIASLLADKLGGTGTFTLNITYTPPPPSVDAPPSPDQCEAELALIQASAKIAFEPGSATIASGARNTMDKIAELLELCGEIRMEIQGHTDSQGRESMNQSLSQSRAQSVLNELRARRVLTSTYVAVGYGESQPIADNGTEQGREDNRRIEFRLIRPKVSEEEESALENVARDLNAKPAASEPDAGSDAENAAVTGAVTGAETRPEARPETGPETGTETGPETGTDVVSGGEAEADTASAAADRSGADTASPPDNTDTTTTEQEAAVSSEEGN